MLWGLVAVDLFVAWRNESVSWKVAKRRRSTQFWIFFTIWVNFRFSLRNASGVISIDLTKSDWREWVDHEIFFSVAEVVLVNDGFGNDGAGTFIKFLFPGEFFEPKFGESSDILVLFNFWDSEIYHVFIRKWFLLRVSGFLR